MDHLRRQLQLAFQNAQKTHNELDELKIRLLSEDTTTRDKLSTCLRNIQQLQEEKKELFKVIQDKELKQEIIN